MSVAFDDDQRALADAVAGLAGRHAPLAATRTQIEAPVPDFDAVWKALVESGLHALHLPEEYGGADAGLPELAVVAEQLGRGLVPGPWLPTVLASAAVALSDSAPADVLTDFAEGATGALVTRGLSARRAGDAWVLTGRSAPALGVPGAEVVVVRADDAGQSRWFVLREVADFVRAEQGVDLTRQVGSLDLEDLTVPAEAALATPDPVRLQLAVATLLAGEASGVIRWALDCAVDYLKTRVQFGRPIGSFQALQHQAAMMLVRSEIAVASAWDAARAQHDTTDQQRVAAAQALVNTLPPAIDVTLNCITLLGGIGFTWEHDAHLYWRRALSLAAVGGAADHNARLLGEAALVEDRDFSVVGDDDLPELRASVGAVLDEVLDLPDDAIRSESWGPARGGSRQARLAEAGLVAPHYPAPYGIAAGAREQAVIVDEFAKRDLAQPTTVIGEWVLPTLLVHGSSEQQERFVMPTLRGEIIWCQLFSEPGAGSDLASLTTRATKVEGGWRINGQKVWNSIAQMADFGILLARTDPEAPKHAGISYFLVDMSTPGVDVRPLRQATGYSEFNEVFLDDVFVPDDCLVNEPGAGWKLAVTTLANERLSMGGHLGHGSAERLKDMLRTGVPGAERADVLRVLGENTAREIALSAMNLRNVLARISDLDVGASISVQKVYNAIAQQEGSRAVVSLLGAGGLVMDDAGHVMDHLGLPAVLFGGGTVEIQLNVIAKRILGLPS